MGAQISVSALPSGFGFATLSPESHHLIAPSPLPNLRLGRVQSGKSLAPGTEFRPAAVVHLDTPSNVRSKLLSFSADPEFDQRFLQVALLVNHDQNAAVVDLDGVVNVLLRSGCESIFVLHGCSVPEGPYFIRDQGIYRTWRLFPDVYEAFQLPTLQEVDSDSFVGITVTYDGILMIPVPSRLHYPQSSLKPLNGVRVTVKDIIDLKGVKTTAQSRSYAKLCAPRGETASFVNRLTDLGAVVIGKTKCTQFASSDQPTADWIDYHCPWNPRGDGYLSPRGSSTGTCVALAGYDWCDVGVGSDTGGSIRGPATVMGLYALRPTHSRDYLSGILPIAQDMDTPGIVCRDVSLLYRVSSHLFPPATPNLEPPTVVEISRRQVASQYLNQAPSGLRALWPFKSWWPGPALEEPSPMPPPPRLEVMNGDNGPKPTLLLYPTDYWGQWPRNPGTQTMEYAVEKLEQHLGVKRVVVSLAERWREENPSGTGLPLAEYLKDTFMTLLWRGYYTNYLPFRKEFEARFDAPPYVHPVIQSCWKRGEETSQYEVEEACKRKAIYADWLNATVLGSSGFNTIMVYPVGDITPFYRDAYRKDPLDLTPSYDWNEREDHQASLAGVPNIVVPVGQVSHPSKVTGREQELPVAISLMSGAGTDSQLTRLLYSMTEKGYFSRWVKVGTHAF